MASASTLARRCSISIRTVRRILHELVQCELIRAEPRFRKDGSRTANRYVMVLGGDDKMTPGLAIADQTPRRGCPGPHDAGGTPRTTTRTVRESPPLPVSTKARGGETSAKRSTADVEGGEPTSSFHYPRRLSPSERIAAYEMLVPLCPGLGGIHPGAAYATAIGSGWAVFTQVLMQDVPSKMPLCFRFL